MPAMVAATRDLEVSRDSFDCSSDESDDAQIALVWSRVRRSGAVRTLAIGAIAAVVVILAVTASTRSATSGSPSASVGLSDAGKATVDQATAIASAELSQANAQAVAPKEHLNDGNPCPDDEELHAGLCYAKCSTLTSGQYNFRQSAWTCCNQAKCSNIFALSSCCKHNLGWCTGFDISGAQEGGKSCPHKPGACLADEELFLNMCYMKCSVLTGGTYPYRTAAATCCKRTDMSCMVEDGLTDGLNGQSLTNASFAVGGGCKDDNADTHCRPHMPQQSLTEA
mmetsp:Transcript_94244/g.237628  ORF Transcript_94244/g.237628 Transcript_94244/m.237628 type:complete len:282 (-) Transcript_94244:205-1050(-)